MTKEHNATDNLTPAKAPGDRSMSESPESLEEPGACSDSSRTRSPSAAVTGCLSGFPEGGAIGSIGGAGSQSETQGQVSPLSQQPHCETGKPPQICGAADAPDTSATGKTSASRNAEISRAILTVRKLPASGDHSRDFFFIGHSVHAVVTRSGLPDKRLSGAASAP